MTFVLEETAEGIDLVITGPWTPDAATCLQEGHADGLVLNYARGFRERNLDFLRGLPLTRLTLLARTIADLSAVYSLSAELLSLDVQSDPRATLELERLPNLRSLSAHWEQVRSSLPSARQLTRLFILSYAEEDLSPLTAVPSLETIVMKDHPAVRSLYGVEELPWLAELGIYLARRLTDITPLQRASSPVLKRLRLPSCQEVNNIEAVASCTALQTLDLSEVGEIHTVAPLAALSSLEKLHMYGSTKVVDGDLRPIAGLPALRDFRMQNRAAYRPSVKEIQAAIADR